MEVSLRWDKTGSGHLCRSCKYAVTRRSGERTLTLCQQVSSPYALIRQPVEACSAYYPKNLTTLVTMQSVAWTLSTDKDRATIGFKPPTRKKGEDTDWISDANDD